MKFKEIGSVAGILILIVFIYFAIVGGFTFSLDIKFTNIQRIAFFVIGIVILILEFASGYRSKNVGDIN